MRFLNAGQAAINPTFTSVTANTGWDYDNTTTHAVVGTGFESGVVCKINNAAGASCGVTFNSSTSLTITMPQRTLADTANTEVVALYFENPTGGVVTAAAAFTYKWSLFSAAPVAWWPADRGITLSGANITGWANQGTGGTGWNLTKHASAANSTVNATDSNFNNQKSVNLLGAMVTGTISFAAPQVYMVAGRGDAIPSYYGVMSESGAFEHSLISGPGQPYLHTNGLDLNGSGQWTTSIAVVGYFNGLSSLLYQNNFTTPFTGNQGANSTITNMTIGDYGPLGLPFAGQVVDVACFSSGGMLSANILARSKFFFNNKYGMSVA